MTELAMLPLVRVPARLAMLCGASLTAFSTAAAAQSSGNVDVRTAQAAPAAPSSAAAAGWWDTLKLSGHVDAGITFNPDSPSDGINFGHLFTDRANSPLLNQLMLTAERPIDPKATGYDVGFKLQGMYGSDARYTHSFNLFDRSLHGRNQFDLVEANVTGHLPLATEGGIDVKAGIFPSPMSAETIDATGNIFYSHSYIFNFGVPFKHTGILATTHLSSIVDLYAGFDTGVNAFVGAKGDNGHPVHGQGGIGLNLLDGKLTVLALTHIGPELPPGTTAVNVNSALRYVNDITATWKISDKLTSITDINYIRDDGLKASGGGIAQYLTYAVDDSWTLAGRAEIWRDDNGAFVAKFPASLDAINAQRGSPNGAVSGGKTTYGELTLGVNYKPGVPKPFEGLVIRPELRFDNALNGTKPFNSGKSDHQVTLAADLILPF
jgi:hypothetical protein